MITKELAAMSDQELAQSLAAAQRELFKLKLQHHTGQLSNTASLVGSRKTIARMLTVQQQRKQIGA